MGTLHEEDSEGGWEFAGVERSEGVGVEWLFWREFILFVHLLEIGVPAGM